MKCNPSAPRAALWLAVASFLVAATPPRACQAAVRYSHLDLNDEDVFGGRENNVTVGLNWHLFSNARVMFNYVYGRVYSSGDVNGAQTRFQIDF